ncbi:SCO6745 family protein [Nonomuraea bangladeshensis]|uniref:SCO6745 family protein n=1 Tax=Nonomuraea bangladeshensis TaxID=404385 RepID=UPI003C2CFC07
MRLERRTWRTLEPLHGMIYFSPEADAAYKRLGLTGRMGYFASRAAAFGPVPAEAVVATFYNFNPQVVHQAIPAAWHLASPADILDARLNAVDTTLRQVLGDVVDSPEMSHAAALAREAAQAISGELSGRPLYAAHAALPWPTAPHLVLWHAATLLREFRGDGHLAALLAAGLSGIEALVTHAATGAVPAETLRVTRGWTETDWAAAESRLEDRGWLRDGSLTERGRREREGIEEATDRMSTAPYAALGDDRCQELCVLARPWSKQLAAELMSWAAARNSRDL